MQSNNEVIILGIRFLKNLNRQLSPIVWPTELEKKTAILLCCCRCEFKLYSLLLQCSGHVKFKNGFNLVQVSIFYMSGKMSSQTVRPKKIKTVALLCLIMASLSSNYFCSFYCTLDISSPKMKPLL